METELQQHAPAQHGISFDRGTQQSFDWQHEIGTQQIHFLKISDSSDSIDNLLFLAFCSGRPPTASEEIDGAQEKKTQEFLRGDAA